MHATIDSTPGSANTDPHAGFSRRGSRAGLPDESNDFSPLIATVRQALQPWYRDLVPIGAGRSGFIFRGVPVGAADAHASEDSVAIKVAYPGLSESSAVYQRFLREATVGAALRHPNVATVSPVRSSGNVTWFEMPFLGGLRLDRVLRNERTLTMAHTIDVLRDMAAALDWAAGQGFAHGALRPSEVYIRPNGRAMLTGFLLDLDAHGNGHPALRPGALGDPAYMAPEQWADSSTVGPAADQYAPAVLAAELIGGIQRVVRNTAGMPNVIPLAIRHDQPLRPGLGLHVNEALIRATSRDPALRFEDCSSFVLALGDPERTSHHALETHAAPVIAPHVRHWRLALVLLVAAAAVALYLTR